MLSSLKSRAPVTFDTFGLKRMAVSWKDPEIGVQWPVKEPVLSARDAKAPALREIWDSLPQWNG